MLPPPVQPREQTLPFHLISWQQFEQLCLRLVRLDNSVEHTQPYGVQGDEQGGIDIYARHRDSSLYSTYQCKNEKEFSAAKIKDAVDVFLLGEWAKKSANFVLCTRESLAPKARADAVEAQAKRLKKKNITFLVWDEIKLCAMLKNQPQIVDDFFDRPWVKVFCGEEEAAKLGNRITASQSETALQAYSAYLVEKIGRVIYRGFANQSPGEKAIELPLERVYIEPLLLPEDERDAHRTREREIVRQLQDPDLPVARQADLEAEFRALKMGDWFRPTVSWREGWAIDVQARRSRLNPLTLREALTSRRRGVVLGAPGSGKSTLLRWLALMCVHSRLHLEEISALSAITDDTLFLPVLVPLAAFANALKLHKATTLWEFIQSHLRALGIDNLERLFISEFAQGTCWILLDGIDEIADVHVRADVVKAIESFLAGLGDNRCLLSSRLHGYERVAGLPHFHLQGMNPGQASQFIFTWNLALEAELNPGNFDVERVREQGASLVSQINDNENLNTLATNPLLLVALLLMHRQNQTLPHSRVEIYHAMTQTLLETWNIWRSEVRYNAGGQVLTPSQLLRVLGKVALWSRREKPGGILRRRELERQFMAACRELGIETDDLEQTAQSYLNAAVEQAGLIEERAPGVFAFWHPTFEEFLAASELANPPEQAAPRLLPLRFDPHWREVILLTVGLIGVVGDDRPAASELVRGLVRTEPPVYEPLLHSALRLGVACLVDNPTLDRDLAQELLLELTRALTQQPFEPMAGSFLDVTDALPNFRPNSRLVEALGELADLDHSMGGVRISAYQLLSNVAATDSKAKQLCWQRCEAGLDKNYPFKDVMARFYATLGCVRAGLYPDYALTNLTGTDQGIFHIARAAKLLDLDERVPAKDAVQRKNNLERVRSVLNQSFAWPTPVSSGPLPEQEAGVIMEPLSAALLLAFAGERSQKVYEIFQEALKPKYDALGVIFDAAHAPLLFDFEDEEATIDLQRLALVALRRWFKHKVPARRLHAANETLRFLESWEEMYVSYIEQAPEFQGRVEEAKTEKFVEAYNANRKTLREEALAALKSCLFVPDLQGRLLAADFLLRRGQVTTVAQAIEKWMKPPFKDDVFHPFATPQLVSALSETPKGKTIVLRWMRGEHEWLKAIASVTLRSQVEYKDEADQIMSNCLDSPHDEIRSSLGGMMGFFALVEGKPLPQPVKAALRSCLGSEIGDASRNAAANLYMSGIREEELLPFLVEYMTTQEVGERFETLRAFQEHDAEMGLLGPMIDHLCLRNSTASAALEKVQKGETLNEEDVSTLQAFVQRQLGEDHHTYFCRRCFTDWIWFNLEAKK